MRHKEGEDREGDTGPGWEDLSCHAEPSLLSISQEGACASELLLGCPAGSLWRKTPPDLPGAGGDPSWSPRLGVCVLAGEVHGPPGQRQQQGPRQHSTLQGPSA